MGNYLFLLLLLACPLMMIWMMRGGHGGHGAGGHAGSSSYGHCRPKAQDADPSLDELRAQRDELDQLIEERESSEPAPAATGVGPTSSGDAA